MCDLTTKWILESAQSLTCALIYWYYVLLEAVTELWGAENSFYRMRPITSSGEWRTHSSEWEGTPPLRKERQAHHELWRAGNSFLRMRGNSPLSREQHAHRWPSIVRGAMLARPAGRATYHRALGSRELIPQNELRCSEGSGMLIGDPLSEGSNASSTNSELWRAENSFWEGTQHSGVEPKAQAGAWPTQIRARSCARNPTLRDF